MLLTLSLAALAMPDGTKNAKSQQARKDTPLPLVPLFEWTPSRTYNNTAPALSAIIPQRSTDTSVQPLGFLPLRLDSIISQSKTQTVTTTQRVKGKRGRARTVKVTKNVERKYSLGLYVYDITADSLVYAVNEDKMMTPASTQKLFVASTFLENRGSDFTFDTSLSTNGRVTTDSVGRPYFKGDIYLKGSFDPTLTTNDVMKMRDAVMRLGVDSIDGRIIVDNHIKASIMQHKGWQWDKIPLAEEFTFTPVTFNEGRATNGGRVHHPELYFAKTMCQQLMHDSIRFSTPEPWGASMDAVHGKHELYRIATPCERVLNRMLKRSNNTYAESVLLNLCKDDNNWSYERCRNMVRNTVRNSIDYINKHRHKDDAKMNDNNLLGYYTIIDGSGLSHDNKTTARSQVNLLRYTFSNDMMFHNMYTHLPIAGVDGTISKRMSGSAAHNNVRAKTGTVNAVSTLSGYVVAATGNLLAFSILVNDTWDSGFARALQDKICTELAQ